MTSNNNIKFELKQGIYYTFENIPQKIIPIPYSCLDKKVYTGITNVRGSDESYSEFGNLSRADRAADNSDMDLNHGINLSLELNNLPCLIHHIEPDFIRIGDVEIEATFLFLEVGRQITYTFVLDDIDYLRYVKEYNFEQPDNT